MNDPRGYKKHFLVGFLLITILYWLFRSWGSIVIGMGSLLILANLWEEIRAIMYNSKKSGKDVLYSMLGGLAGCVLCLITFWLKL